MGGKRRHSVSGSRRPSVAGTSGHRQSEDPALPIDGFLGSLLKRRVSELVRNPELRKEVSEKISSQETKEGSSQKLETPIAISSESKEVAHSDVPEVPYPVVNAGSIDNSAVQTVREARKCSKPATVRTKKLERSRSKSKDVQTSHAHVDDMAHQFKGLSDIIEELKMVELPRCILNVLSSIETKISSYANLFNLATSDLLALEELSKLLDVQSGSMTQLLSTWAEHVQQMQKSLQQELSKLDPAARDKAVRWLPAVEHCLVKLGILSTMVDTWQEDVETTSEGTVTPGALLQKPIAVSSFTPRWRNSATCSHDEFVIAEHNQQNPEQHEIQHNSDNGEHGTADNSEHVTADNSEHGIADNSELVACDNSDSRTTPQHKEEEGTSFYIDSDKHQETKNQLVSISHKQEGWEPLGSDSNNSVSPCSSSSVTTQNEEQEFLGEYSSVSAQPYLGTENCGSAPEPPGVPASIVQEEEELPSCCSTEEGQSKDLTELSTPETLDVDGYSGEEQKEEGRKPAPRSSSRNQASSPLVREDEAPTGTPKRESSSVQFSGKIASQRILKQRQDHIMDGSSHSPVPATAGNSSVVGTSESVMCSSGHTVLENPCVQVAPERSSESITAKASKSTVTQPCGQRPKYHRPRTQYCTKLEDLTPMQERLRNAILEDDSSPLQLMEIMSDDSHSKHLPQLPQHILGSLRASSSSKRTSKPMQPHTVLPSISRRRSWGGAVDHDVPF